MNLYETVLALFCNPEGEPCMKGSDGDRKLLKEALDNHKKETLSDPDKVTIPRDVLDKAIDRIHNEVWLDTFDKAQIRQIINEDILNYTPTVKREEG